MKACIYSLTVENGKIVASPKPHTDYLGVKCEDDIGTPVLFLAKKDVLKEGFSVTGNGVTDVSYKLQAALKLYKDNDPQKKNPDTFVRGWDTEKLASPITYTLKSLTEGGPTGDVLVDKGTGCDSEQT